VAVPNRPFVRQGIFSWSWWRGRVSKGGRIDGRSGGSGLVSGPAISWLCQLPPCALLASCRHRPVRRTLSVRPAPRDRLERLLDHRRHLADALAVLRSSSNSRATVQLQFPFALHTATVSRLLHESLTYSCTAQRVQWNRSIEIPQQTAVSRPDSHK
jgi:hypothetical protein